MYLLRSLFVSSALAAVALAQDRITLNNGDTLTGKVKTMADGKIVVSSPIIGDITVSLADIQNLVTEAEVVLRTVTGETFRRRIAGIENSHFRLDGDAPAVPLGSLIAINPPKVKPPAWTGSVSVNSLWLDGNTQKRSVGALGEASRKTEADRITADAHWDYAEDKPSGASWNLTARRAGAGLKYDYFVSERWYTLATSRALGDAFADLSLRITAGAGVGYTVIDTEKTTLLTEAGLSYFDEDYISSVPSKDYIAARVAYKLTHKISDTIKLNHAVEAYPSLEDKNDLYLQMKTELLTNLTDSMFASLTWIMDYDNTPSPKSTRLARADHRVMFSLGWSF